MAYRRVIRRVRRYRRRSLYLRGMRRGIRRRIYRIRRM